MTIEPGQDGLRLTKGTRAMKDESDTTVEESYTLLASSEEENHRVELREYDDAYHAVQLRPKVGGGWYIRNIIVIPKGAANDRD